MSAPRIVAIIPAKSFAAAKTRLAPLLSPEERMALSAAMFEDVLSATAAAPEIEETVVVTTEPAAAAIAARHGARIVTEAAADGLNAAILAASEVARGSGADGVIVVPADLPQLTGGVLRRAAYCLFFERSAVLARAVADGGTNLLGIRPIGLIEPAFGRDSFDRHRAALRAAEANPFILCTGETDRDVDRPADLEHFWNLGTETRAHALLSSFCIRDRFRRRRATASAFSEAPA